jgi:hypothetical protein
MESQPLVDSVQRIKPQWEIDADKADADLLRESAAWDEQHAARSVEFVQNCESIRATFASIDDYQAQEAAIRARRLADQNMPFSERVERRKIVILRDLNEILEAAKRIFSQMPKVFQAIAALITAVAMAILGYVAYHHVAPLISS